MTSFSDEKKESLRSFSSGSASSDSNTLENHLQAPRSFAETNAEIEKLAQKHGVNRAKLMWKQDICIVPAICVLYILAYLDRINISNAQLYGMSKDIGLVGTQYNTALTVFFAPYVVLEIPSNFLLKKLKPHVWLPICVSLFGAVSLAQGFVKSFGGLVACRVLLGALETGMFPGCFYLLSMWYRREEAQKRYSFFFSSTCLAGAFGGLIAYGVNHLNMKRGLEGWRWLFIIEGAVTIFCGLCLYFCIADFPEDAKFLKENERVFIREKLALDQGDSQFDAKPNIKYALAVFKEWKVWVAGVMYFGLVVSGYGYAYFAPSIIKTFGYSPVKAQVYSIFPWLVSFGGSMLFAVCSDFLRHRFLFTVVGTCIGIAGFIMLLATDATPAFKEVRYAACFLVCWGMYATMPIVICWSNMNFSGHYRKMVGSAWQVGFANIGGIIATYSYLAKDAPAYTPGVSVGLAMTVLALVACCVYVAGLYIENRRRRAGKCQEKFDQLSEEDKRYAGDLNPNFVYQY